MAVFIELSHSGGWRETVHKYIIYTISVGIRKNKEIGCASLDMDITMGLSNERINQWIKNNFMCHKNKPISSRK